MRCATTSPRTERLTCKRLNAAHTSTSSTRIPLPPPSQVVTSGTGTLNVLFLGVPLFQGTFTTCGATNISLPLGVGAVQILSLACPTVAGKVGGMTVNVTVGIPAGVPSGPYQVTLSANDQAGKLAYCANAAFTIGSRSDATWGRPALRGAIVDAGSDRAIEEEWGAPHAQVA